MSNVRALKPATSRGTCRRENAATKKAYFRIRKSKTIRHLLYTWLERKREGNYLVFHSTVAFVSLDENGGLRRWKMEFQKKLLIWLDEFWLSRVFVLSKIEDLSFWDTNFICLHKSRYRLSRRVVYSNCVKCTSPDIVEFGKSGEEKRA